MTNSSQHNKPTRQATRETTSEGGIDMGERRSLIDGLKPPPPPVDPTLEKSFVFGSKEAENVGEPT